MFLDIVKHNRSYRSFDESYTFTREQLAGYIECARFAPSSINAQPFRYYLVCEPETVEKVRPLTKWARALPDLTLPPIGHHATGFIIICQDTKLGASIPRYQKDVGIVAQTILLAAAEQGLGGCMIGNYSGQEVSETLRFPANLTPVLIIALGKPDEEIHIVDANEGDSTAYYRDEQGNHFVPKRKLEDIILPDFAEVRK